MSTRHYSIETFTPGQSVGYLIKRCGLLMSARAEKAFESQPVSFTQWIVLMNLRERKEPMSATELSSVMCHDMGALTRIVDTLEKAGFVKRQRSLRDRRAVELELTPAGRQQAENSMHLMLELLNELLAPFSEAEMNTLISQLQRMLERLQTFEPDFEAIVTRASESAGTVATALPVARKRRTRQ